MDRKYYQAYNTEICYQEPRNGLFNSYPGKHYKILFYEENGKFFEFLTGVLIGLRYIEDGSQFVYSDEFGRVFDLNGYYPPSEMSAEEFANKARRYMVDKNDIIPHLNKLFDKWRDNQIKNSDSQKSKSCTKTEAENWLDNLLSNR